MTVLPIKAHQTQSDLFKAHHIMSTTSGKKYGLIISARKKASSAAKPSVFGDSSDEEDSDGRRLVNISLLKENKKLSKQHGYWERSVLAREKSHDSASKALEEDPTIFDYDGHYDKMVEQRKKADPRLKKRDTKPKYILALKRVAEKRKLEQEIIYERKVQREVEEEKEAFGEKETYVTSAYRKKLEERVALEEELRREEAEEARNNVTKEMDLSRFYRNILHQKTSADTPPNPPTSQGARAEKEDAESRERERNEPFLDEPEPTDEVEARESDVEEDKELGDTEGHEEPPQSPDQPLPPPQELPAQTVVTEEERRKRASVKRTNEESLMSARERYLARKKARISVTATE